MRGEVELQSMDCSEIENTPVQVALCDIGRGGRGFVCPRIMPPDSTWRLCILHQGHIVSHHPFNIRFCKQIDDVLQLIGGQFCIETGVMLFLGVPPASLTVMGGAGVDDFEKQ